MKNFDLKDSLLRGPQYFLQNVLPIYVGDRKYVEPSETMKGWIDLPFNNYPKKVALVASRGHLKTTILTNILPIYYALRYSKSITYILSYTQNQAVEFLGRIKSFFETTPVFNKLSGKTWKETKLSFVNGSRIYALGITSSATRGPHPDLIVVDDPLPVEAINPHITGGLKFIEDQYFSAITGMTMPTTKIITCGTRMHSQDLFNNLSQNEQYAYYKFPCWNPITHDDILWEQMYNREWLERKKQEMGNLHFAREYECEPISSEASLFPSFITMLCVDKNLTFQKESFPNGYTVIGCDFSISGKTSADFTVYTVVQKYGDYIYVLDIEKNKGLTYEEQINLLIRLYHQYKANLIVVESNSFQKIYSCILQGYALPILDYRTDMSKNTQDKGIPFMIPFFEKKLVVLPNEPYVYELINELESLYYDVNRVMSTSNHDDMAMSLFFAFVGLREMGNLNYELKDDEFFGFM